MIPHKVEFCGECQKRTDLIKSKKDLTEWDDYTIYDQSKDTEYMEYLERQKAVNSPYAMGRFSCIPCNKHNFSQEYYENHLTGRAHKVKMGEIPKADGKKKKRKKIMGKKKVQYRKVVRIKGKVQMLANRSHPRNRKANRQLYPLNLNLARR